MILKDYILTIDYKFHLQVNGYTNTFNVIADKCPGAPENQEYLNVYEFHPIAVLHYDVI